MTKPPPPPEPLIHAAARTGDLAALERLIREGHDVNLRADLEVDNGLSLRGLTPLMVAARSLDGATADTLRWLLDHGADLHARSEGGETAAWYAAGQGGRWWFHEWRLVPDHVDRLRLLLDAGLSVHETNGAGRSLVTEAARAGDPARLRLLLERGAAATPSVDQEALASRHRDLLEFLARANRDAGLEENEAREMAAGLAGPAPTEPDSFAIPLFCAAQSGSADCVDLLLQAGAPVDGRDAQGGTPLMHAGSPAVARRFLAAGADVRALSRRKEDVLQEILGGAACDAGLCGPGRFAVARVLIEHGADVQAFIGEFSRSRLYLAAFRHQADVVDFLLAAGVSARHADPEDGSPPLHGICWQGEYEDPSANAACERIIRALVAASADVNARDKRGCTPLHEAAGGDWGNATAVRVLLELGAEPDPRNKGRQTPLMLAAARGERACLELLLQAGADPKPALRHAREHHATWVTINREGTDLPRFGQTEEARACHHRATLAEAAACFDVLRNAARNARKRSRSDTPRKISRRSLPRLNP